tara:strand:+ start:181 stop:384 length:204 start_codon:yes stop_codon:yes gene_type:complete
MKKNCKKNSPIITLGNGTQFKEYVVRNGKKLWCGIPREITKEMTIKDMPPENEKIYRKYIKGKERRV